MNGGGEVVERCAVEVGGVGVVEAADGRGALTGEGVGRLGSVVMRIDVLIGWEARRRAGRPDRSVRET